MPGTVRLVFQPNEEFGAWGDQIVKQGENLFLFLFLIFLFLWKLGMLVQFLG